MTPAELKARFPSASRSTILRNLANGGAELTAESVKRMETGFEPTKKRIRQSSKPLMNKLETDWLNKLRSERPTVTYLPQSVRLKIATGAWYKPDVFCFEFLMAYECKGPKFVKGCSKGLLALKVAAKEYPQIRFVLVWREKGQWFEQPVIP